MKIYETYALESLKTPLIKFGAKEYFFRACLVALCYDILEAQVYLDKFNEADPSFQNSREGELIKEILRSVDDADVNIFVDAVKKYDSISRLDPWFVQLLNRIKKPLEEFVDLT
uniref:Alpha-soluble NSF attachment protein (Trinotate prediction) n=1 Tax=Henneguya salminicola TaxID=69463 RepID=A0A6G3MGU0_HENSL